MPTRNVVLTDRQEDLIEALVRSGRFRNANEVMREGLRLIERDEAKDGAKLEGLRAAARLGAAALERGDFREFPDAAALIAHLNDLVERVRAGAKGG